MSKREFLFIPLARWDAPYSSTALAIAQALAHQHKVFFVDNPFTWKDVLTRPFHPQVKRRILHKLGIRRIHGSSGPAHIKLIPTPFILPTNWLPKGKLYEMLSHLNQRWVERAILKAIHRHKLEQLYLVNVFNPFYGQGLIDHPSIYRSIYYSVDKMDASAYVKKHGPELELQMMKEVDMILATSTRLEQEAKLCKVNQVHLLPNGVDFELFNSAVTQPLDRPKDLPEGATVLYIGAIGLRIDHELVHAIASQFPQFQFVFIGPVSNNFPTQKWLSTPNIHLLGSKPQSVLPAYLQHASCTFIPFYQNDLTSAIYPLKINEYLAAGKAVISTGFSADLKSFSPWVQIADTPAEMGQKIQKLVDADTTELQKERVEKARQASWTKRAQKLLNLLEHL